MGAVRVEVGCELLGTCDDGLTHYVLGEAGAPAPFHPAIAAYAANALTWFPEAGFGYFEVQGAPYDAAYFARYREQAETPIGRSLMAARVQLVRRHVGDIALAQGPVLDVGIGSGAFVEACWAEGIAACGFDVNPAGVAWLQRNSAFAPLYTGRRYPVLTFWDSLEHIREPQLALAACGGWAFVALPIFRDAEHVLASKHYRRDEHYWYFTRDGFRRFAQAEGFDVVDIVATETALGREDIETFVLRRNR